MSPEIWNKSEYSMKSDVYAFGMIVYEIFITKKLFEGCNYFQIISMLSKKYRPPFDKPIPSVYKDLIERCWNEKPSERPTFNQIITKLKNDPKFITDNINKDEYLNYIKYIDEYKSSFAINNEISLFSKVKLNATNINIFRNFKLKLFPISLLN